MEISVTFESRVDDHRPVCVFVAFTFSVVRYSLQRRILHLIAEIKHLILVYGLSYGPAGSR